MLDKILLLREFLFIFCLGLLFSDLWLAYRYDDVETAWYIFFLTST